MQGDPRGVLSATRDLTQRVRVAQRGAWFPLLVFAAVTFAAIPFNRYGRHPTECRVTQGGGSVCTIHSALALWYWPVALMTGYLVITWFYLRRSHHRGVGTRVQPYVAVGAVLTLLVTLWALWANAHPAFLVDTLRLRSGEPTVFLYRIASPAGAIGLALLLLDGSDEVTVRLKPSITHSALPLARVEESIAVRGHGSAAAARDHAALPARTAGQERQQRRSGQQT